VSLDKGQRKEYT